MTENAAPSTRVALVTGAASGVGRALVMRLLAEGHSVVATDVQPIAGFDSTSVHTIQADVRDPEAMRSAAEAAVHHFGGLDTVAAVAGVVRFASVLDMPDADRDLVLGVNLIGVWNTVRAALPALLDRGEGGRVVVCASVQSVVGTAGLAAYTASKHAVVGFVKALALELAPYGITANAVSPASIDTPMATGERTEEQLERIGATTPVGRFSTAAEVAAAMAWVAGPETAYLTGANIVLDGGTSVVNVHAMQSDGTLPRLRLR
ncbi:MAG TPA: SDR family oxidoreductase [Candidatus Dormibacteraeota bacterium]|jgi:NAD(P)-dependent dehydrogenase (short-subunit alcohol dehydrogenase family)|nr:SDR family oxidoreductase [Candidatus Dormibacteraeota bacterium]